MSLQIPSPSRPVSATVAPTSPPSRRQPPQHRASHQVVSSTATLEHEQQQQQSAFMDVYSHPAAVAFAAAHPRRTIPKFGPYLLLQTLGEGEFGKVKLGLHCQWGEEVAVKLIRRGNVDTAVRMSKVEREIEVLRTLKHPNIVRLYDVIETDKYIGIIIEYASGGELFDHILAHRYLRERDASKLFSQLISGVWYIHQKKIVHRDLKLENLLLDRHRNVIITDFGFANRFEHKADDLMQTSCGSPCYAAPELVISEGLYVGSAVDIWSCGVILYAMLAGYLPFDDDPANPDGDNINLLYKYIVNTPLSFPEYISDEARDLLKLMLVPDPRKRASLEAVMRHPWLAAYHVVPEDATPGVPMAFGRTAEELERAAMEQHQMKRRAYINQMRAASNAQAPAAATAQITRAQTQGNAQSQRRQPETLYDSASGAAYADDDDPFAAPGSAHRRPAEAVLDEGVVRGEPRARGADGDVVGKEKEGQTPRKDKGKEKEKEKEDKFRHTIQVEYDERKRARAGSGGRERERERTPNAKADASASPTRQKERERSRTPTRGAAAATSPVSILPPTPVSPPAQAAAAATNGTTNSNVNGAPADVPTSTSMSPSASITERRERRRRGSASEGVTNPTAGGKPLPPSPSANASTPPSTWKGPHSPTSSTKTRDAPTTELVNGAAEKEKERPLAKEVFMEKEQAVEGEKAAETKDGASGVDQDKEQEQEQDKEKQDKKKTRRNTLTGLTVMVNPINSIRAGMGRKREPSTATSATPPTQLGVPNVPPAPHTGGADKTFDDAAGAGMKASSSKARKVMQWIRKGRDSLTVGGPTISVPSPAESIGTASSTTDAGGDAASPVQVYVTTPTTGVSPIVAATVAGGRKESEGSVVTPTGTTASATSSFASRIRRSVNIGGAGGGGGSRRERTNERADGVAPAGSALRVHHGAVDTETVTSGKPPEVMRHVRAVLEGMGVEIQVESEFKFRCIRAKQRRNGGTARSVSGSVPGPGGVAAFTMSGSAGSNGVDRRGLPMPSQASFSGSGMLRGLLMRRQSSQVSAAGPNAGSTSFDADDSLNDSGILASEPQGQADTVYGTSSEDAGDEVRFYVELTRLNGLLDTYSLDIRRLKGNLRSYKFLYDTLKKRAELQR